MALIETTLSGCISMEFLQQKQNTVWRFSKKTSTNFKRYRLKTVPQKMFSFWRRPVMVLKPTNIGDVQTFSTTAGFFLITPISRGPKAFVLDNNTRAYFIAPDAKWIGYERESNRIYCRRNLTTGKEIFFLNISIVQSPCPWLAVKERSVGPSTGISFPLKLWKV